MRTPLRSIFFAAIISIRIWFSFSFIIKHSGNLSSDHVLTKQDSISSKAVADFITLPIRLINGDVKINSDSVPLLPDSLSKIDTLLIAHKSQFRMNLFSKGKLL